ncbi:MerR family DNA-binding transcriptional regulator [Paenibacillus eucommiae]|uniref:MerR family DNA-binding transcriptional regulator n=1 Tax=Paenibacillus eucommiae TaxID=1355755 RepID=UPI002479B265|nr:MerR family DNA-binding transcriptional regulator [Paenibacillus eucommiae]
MIRYYEQTGLIPAADRKASGYRDYSDTDVFKLGFTAFCVSEDQDGSGRCWSTGWT